MMIGSASAIVAAVGIIEDVVHSKEVAEPSLFQATMPAMPISRITPTVIIAPRLDTHLPVSRVSTLTSQLIAINTRAMPTCGQNPRSGKNMSDRTTENIR